MPRQIGWANVTAHANDFHRKMLSDFEAGINETRILVFTKIFNKTQTQDPRSQSLRAQVREFELAYASVFFKNFLLREIHKANFRKDVIYIFKF